MSTIQAFRVGLLKSQKQTKKEPLLAIMADSHISSMSAEGSFTSFLSEYGENRTDTSLTCHLWVI